MKDNKLTRSSNIELLRIIAMAMIVLNHFANYSGLLEVDNHVNRIMGYFFILGGKTGASIFVLIGSFFISDKHLKSETVLRIWFNAVIVSFVCYLVAFAAGTIGIKEIYKSFFPITFNSYWFVTV